MSQVVAKDYREKSNNLNYQHYVYNFQHKNQIDNQVENTQHSGQDIKVQNT